MCVVSRTLPVACCVLPVACCLLASRPLAAQPEYWFDHVHLSVDGGASPFASVQYAVRELQGSWLVVETKQYPGIPVYDNRVVAVAPGEGAALLRSLAELGALDLADAGAEAPFALAWRVEMGFQGRCNAFVVRGPELLEDLRYAGIVERVTAFVEEKAGPAYFRDLVVPEADLGLLNLSTSPPVQVEIDGVTLGRSTPVSGLELAPGVHVATLRSQRHGISRRVKFTVYRGQVTTLNLNLTGGGTESPGHPSDQAP